MKNKNKDKIGLGKYLKRYKLPISMYILIYIIAGACSIFITLMFATAIEMITAKTYDKAIFMMVGIVGVVFAKRICWYITNLLYSKYSVKIMAELNLDLAKQAFKLNSKTYNDHETGTFVQRIVTDPERVVGHLADIVDIVTDLLTSFIMLVYITTLNVWISLILVVMIAIGLILEFKRIKVRRVNRKDVRKKSDRINSLTTEIVRSEKDIKSLGLEDRLSEISKDNYDDYRKANFKFSFVDMNFWSVRNLMVEVVGVAVLIFGVWLMDRGLLTLAAFMIIYSNNNTLYSLIWGVGSIANSIVDIRVCTERMFSLFDEKEFVTEKFGTLTFDNFAGGEKYNSKMFLTLSTSTNLKNQKIKMRI